MDPPLIYVIDIPKKGIVEEHARMTKKKAAV